jgi:hypothetical protein
MAQLRHSRAEGKVKEKEGKNQFYKKGNFTKFKKSNSTWKGKQIGKSKK